MHVLLPLPAWSCLCSCHYPLGHASALAITRLDMPLLLPLPAWPPVSARGAATSLPICQSHWLRSGLSEMLRTSCHTMHLRSHRILPASPGDTSKLAGRGYRPDPGPPPLGMREQTEDASLGQDYPDPQRSMESLLQARFHDPHHVGHHIHHPCHHIHQPYLRGETLTLPHKR